MALSLIPTGRVLPPVLPQGHSSGTVLTLFLQLLLTSLSTPSVGLRVSKAEN